IQISVMWLVASACLGLGLGAKEEIGPPANSGSLAPAVPAPRSVPLNDARILKLIPDYQTVQDTSKPVAPMTAAQKWRLGWREAADPSTSAALPSRLGFLSTIT